MIDHKNPFLGASPDGIINCACCGRGVLEIKCPFKHRNSSIDEAAMPDAAFCLNRQGQLKKLHRYNHPALLAPIFVQSTELHINSDLWNTIIGKSDWSLRIPCWMYKTSSEYAFTGWIYMPIFLHPAAPYQQTVSTRIRHPC